jgi:carboxyl-terminal processing protease
VSLAVAGVLVPHLPLAHTARADDLAAGEQRIAEWSQEVWQRASSGTDNSDDALKILDQLPPGADKLGLADFAAALERRRTNVATWEAKRATTIAEVRAKIADHMAKNELRLALKDANELYQISPDKSAILVDPSIQDLTQRARQAAQDAEAAGRWLEAQSLYSRLHWLYEEQATYKADVTRLGQRLLMLRLYTPEKLYEMRNTERIAEGEEPLPPYNAVGEDWREKLRGITSEMVIAALSRASIAHVERVGIGPMLVKGYQAVRTLVTTSDLSAAFPGITDDAARARLLAEIDAGIDKYGRDPLRAYGFQDLYASLRSLASVNRESVKIPDEAFFHEFGNGASSALDDFSDFIWPDELARFQKSTEGNFPGVGIHITLDDALQLKVVTPVEGTPAARAGIRANDLIRKINGEATLGIALQQAVDRITGPVNSPVTLSVERQGTEGLLDFTMKRAVIPIYSVKGWERSGPRETDWNWFVDPTDKIGYLRVTQFSRETSREMRQAVLAMQRDGVKALILDLRYNPGGLLDEAVNISNFFVGGQKMIVSQENKDGVTDEAHRATSGEPMLKDIPVVVLLNTGSASASEIVAGCLQDHKAAVLVGERSFGKGSVQNVYPLGRDAAAFKLTTHYYKLPNGRLIHRRDGDTQWGVEPDIHVEMLPEQIDQALKLRLDADVPPGEAGATPADPKRLLAEGIDPQLESAVLLLRARVAGVEAGKSISSVN